MEKPNYLTPEEVNKRLEYYDENFNITFEEDRAIYDISDIVQEWANLVDPLVELLGSRSEVARADKQFVDQMMKPRLADAIKRRAVDLSLAHVRIDGDMLALQQIPRDEGDTLNYFTSDEAVAVEGTVRGVFCGAMPPRDDLRKIIDTAHLLGPHMRPVSPELYVCITLEDGKLVERESRDEVEQLGEVIVPLYPDSISMYRIDTLRS